MKLKITNQTYYDTRELRRLALRAAKEEEMAEHARKIGRLHVRIKYKRRGTYQLGYGYYHSGRSVLNLPPIPPSTEEGWRELKLQLAHTMVHEFGHNLGLTHRDMRGRARYDKRHPNWRDTVRWAEGYTLHYAPPTKTKPTATERVTGKLKHAEKMLQLAGTRAKRAQTLLKKWRSKVRYYQKQQMAYAQRDPKPKEQ